MLTKSILLLSHLLLYMVLASDNAVSDKEVNPEKLLD